MQAGPPAPSARLRGRGAPTACPRSSPLAAGGGGRFVEAEKAEGCAPSEAMPRGLLARLAAAECGGARPVRSLVDFAALAPGSFRALNRSAGDAPSALLHLAAVHAARDAAGARAALLALSTACHFTSDGNAREQPEALAAQASVVVTGGYTLLVALLMADWDAAGAPSAAAAAALAEVRAEAAAILRELCFGVPGFAEALSGNANLAPRLLHLCGDAELFSTASALLEEVRAPHHAAKRPA